uniref:(northern house mosquito) hypothetical protein n=1 Tax=Culex pipiens TaxID=7175 RepID=A0A8D8H8C7_CULPI
MPIPIGRASTPLFTPRNPIYPGIRTDDLWIVSPTANQQHPRSSSNEYTTKIRKIPNETLQNTTPHQKLPKLRSRREIFCHVRARSLALKRHNLEKPRSTVSPERS